MERKSVTERYPSSLREWKSDGSAPWKGKGESVFTAASAIRQTLAGLDSPRAAGCELLPFQLIREITMFQACAVCERDEVG